MRFCQAAKMRQSFSLYLRKYDPRFVATMYKQYSMQNKGSCNQGYHFRLCSISWLDLSVAFKTRSDVDVINIDFRKSFDSTSIANLFLN